MNHTHVNPFTIGCKLKLACRYLPAPYNFTEPVITVTIDTIDGFIGGIPKHINMTQESTGIPVVLTERTLRKALVCIM